jgi:5-formyltetrahydrofolate cyclo-ligase
MAEIIETEWSGRDQDKDRLRSDVWTELEQTGAARGNPFGHIPSFKGAEAAAARLAGLPVWQRARVIKCNPDSAQIPVRLRALQEGKKLYMAVPRLAQESCFVELTAEALQAKGVDLATAATHQGATKHGRLVGFEEMEPIDLVVVGCVAVARDGGRTGKGAGFADLELGMLRQFGLIGPDTPIVATVHPVQVVEPVRLPMQSHDWALTWIVTPEEVIETQVNRPQPEGLIWERIQPDQLETIPVLRRLRATHQGSQS